jgi:hypothetical protein
MQDCGCGPAKLLTVLPGMSESGPYSLSQDLTSNTAKTASRAAIARPAGAIRSNAVKHRCGPVKKRGKTQHDNQTLKDLFINGSA